MELGTICGILKALPFAATAYFAQVLLTISRAVKHAEEPDEGRSSRQGCNPAGESPAVSVARVGHVVMPHPGMGNHPGYAWCKRPGRPVDTAVGATWRSSERRSLKVNE